MRRLAAIAMLIVACQRAPQDSGGSDELQGARAQAQRFFDAVAQGDCTTLTSLVPSASPPGACEKMLHEMREDLGIKLVDLADVRRDGRDRNAILVRATVMRHDEQKTMLLRLTHEHGAWQIAL